MIEPALHQLLVSTATVQAIVADRVWFVTRPQGERQPGIVVTREGGNDPGTLDGPAGYVQGSLNLDVLAPTYQQAKQLAATVTTAIDGYSGTVGDTMIDYLTIEDESDIPVVPPEGAAKPQTFGVSLNVSFMCSN